MNTEMHGTYESEFYYRFSFDLLHAPKGKELIIYLGEKVQSILNQIHFKQIFFWECHPVCNFENAS